MDAITSLIVVAVIFVIYRLVKFIQADADLTLLGHSLNSSYFNGKVVWVTGASSGIGEELCRQLSAIGAKVILSARSQDKLKSVLESLAHPENCHIFPLDICDRKSVRDAPLQVKSLFGHVDILINNAGVSMRATFMEVTEEAARKLMEVDLLGTSFLTQGVIKSIMLEQGGGHIVNISSISGKFGPPVRTYYAAAKFGLMGLMDALRLEMLGKNIFVTNVCPGPVKTPVSENALNAQGDKYRKKTDIIEKGMKVERCVELTLIGVSNKLREVWISKHPFLFITYLFQYAPSLGHYAMKQKTQNIITEIKT